MRRLLHWSVGLGCVFVATVLALLLRDNLEPSLYRLKGIAPYLGVSLLTAALVFPAMGTNRGIWRYSGLGDVLRIVAAVVVTVLGAVGLCFAINRLDGVARALPILQAILLVGLMSAVRVILRLHHARRARAVPGPMLLDDSQETLLVVGVGPVAELFLRSVKEFAHDRIRIAGILGRDEYQSGRLYQNQTILGAPEDVAAVIRKLEVHGLFVNRVVVTVAFDQLSHEAREALAGIEAASNIVIDYFAERVGLRSPRNESTARFAAAAEGRAAIDPKASLQALVSSPSLKRPYWKWKRALDFAAAAGLIIVLSPLIVLASLLVVADVGPAAIFWQVRPGAKGRPFKLYKFRTMGPAHDGEGRRVPDAQRLSAIGRFLRRTRLDELPQLYNILIGEMSFVGPRPLLPVDQSPGHSARLAVRPGLTGWAQINGGREVSAADKAAMDLWYIHNASFGRDLVIVLRTLGMLALGERANAAAVRIAWQDLIARGAPILEAPGGITSAGKLEHRP
jgi:lipopolysaccharide/colanic/teichoic acid biosynthesis glycosyltransferase